MDMLYDFSIRHNMHAVEWKLIAMINKNKSLIKKLNRNWRLPLFRSSESYDLMIVNIDVISIFI